METGRWVLQVAPTGYSAFITDTGGVVSRTDIGEATVLSDRVELRDGQTIATRVGDWLALALAVGAVGGGWWWERRRRQQPVTAPRTAPLSAEDRSAGRAVGSASEQAQ
jgi:apolipoprotein N-acyltransferase